MTLERHRCKEATKGQTCFICMEGIKRRTGEGLVSGFCACRGGSSFAHVSCLAEQAKIVVEEAKANNLDDTRFPRWTTCDLCGQEYHGFVAHALGWASWKTYLGLPETAELRHKAMYHVAHGLYEVSRCEEALPVYETCLANSQRLWPAQAGTQYYQLSAMTSIANCYTRLGRRDEALALERLLYAQSKALYGIEARETLINALNLAKSLIHKDDVAEAKPLLRQNISRARRSIGDDDDVTLDLRDLYAKVLVGVFVNGPGGASAAEDLREGVTILEDIERRSRRVFGADHPQTLRYKKSLGLAREIFAFSATK